MRIAILEDDDAHATVMAAHLSRAGHVSVRYSSVRKMQGEFARQGFEIAVLDWRLPDGDGISAMNWIRSQVSPFVPVLFVSVLGGERDIIRALEAGADDYVAKPVRPDELVSRVNALARRISAGGSENRALDFEPYHFEPSTLTARFSDRNGNIYQVELSHKEFQLAVLLFRNIGAPVAKSQIWEQVWKLDTVPDTRLISSNLTSLRQKLSLRSESGYRITSVHEFGYRLERLGDERRDHATAADVSRLRNPDPAQRYSPDDTIMIVLDPPRSA